MHRGGTQLWHFVESFLCIYLFTVPPSVHEGFRRLPSIRLWLVHGGVLARLQRSLPCELRNGAIVTHVVDSFWPLP